MELNKIYIQDSREFSKNIPSKFVDCIVTSPPYYGLRDYGVDGQIGLEQSPEEFINELVLLFRSCKDALKDDGTLWVNIGDSYWGGKGQSGQKDADTQESRNLSGKSINSRAQQMGGKGITMPKDGKHPIIKPKDLIGIPWMLAFALRADGWYLRQDIIWSKPNPMPESVTDRCTKSHEYIFLLSKSPKYYYDANSIKTPIKDGIVQAMLQQMKSQKDGPGRKPREGVDSKGGNQASSKGIKAYSHRGEGDKKLTGHSGNFDSNGNLIGDGFANKKSVWNVVTKPFKEAHFATFPEELIVDCIKAGCRENGVVYDPFMGAGTTALVARKLGRNFIGAELNPKYVEIANARLQKELGLFL